MMIPRLFLVVVVVLLSSPIAVDSQPQPFTVTDLGSFNGCSSSNPAPNELGMTGIIAGCQNGQAAIWHDGVVIVRGSPGSVGSGVNDAGALTGAGWLDSARRGIVWQQSEMVVLGTLGGNVSEAFDINNIGQVVGSATTSNEHRHAILWQNAEMTDLGTLPGGMWSTAIAVNDLGEVAGSAQAANSQPHAFLWRAGTMIDLGTGPTFNSVASDVNDSAQVVGVLPGGPVPNDDRGFIWQNGVMTQLSGLFATASTAAYGIDNQGRVVGYSLAECDPAVTGFCVPRTRAVMWSNGAIADLNTLLPPESGWFLAAASDINDRGQIIGWGFHGGVRSAFLLAPVSPAPTSVEQCKNGGWTTFSDPTFRNQGQCVSSIRRHRP